jgi:hypothetical protein
MPVLQVGIEKRASGAKQKRLDVTLSAGAPSWENAVNDAGSTVRCPLY